MAYEKGNFNFVFLRNFCFFSFCTRDFSPVSSINDKSNAVVILPQTSNIIIIDKNGRIIDTGIEDKVLDDGMTISRKIQECAHNARNHGDFVSCMAHLTNWLMENGLITNKEKGIIMNVAARADIP